MSPGPGGPTEPEIRVLPDPAAVSLEAATRIEAALVAGVERRGRADWATTGGSTPIGIYDVLSRPPSRDRVPWNGVHVWWGDDRFVPRDHPLSNVLPFDQVLVRAAIADEDLAAEPGVPIPPGNVHPMPMAEAIGTGAATAWVAEAYERELRAAVLPESGGFPVLDLILVGIGGDGHVLSVFPGSRAFEADPTAWAADVPAPAHIEPHVARVSLNPGFLAAARLVIVVALGTGKAGIVATVLGPERDTARWPSQHARRANAVWLLDATAGAKLDR
jgi:6-phosphogluconolactonase